MRILLQRGTCTLICTSARSNKACECRCATPFGIDVVGITELIAISGALVGGLVARQRKQETERLNEQLRRINMQLRQQARAGTLYAPGLSYAPVPRSSVAPSAVGSPEVATAEAGASTATLSPPAGLDSTDEVTSPEQEACRDVLREGKRLLRSQQGTLMYMIPAIHTPLEYFQQKIFIVLYSCSTHLSCHKHSV